MNESWLAVTKDYNDLSLDDIKIYNPDEIVQIVMDMIIEIPELKNEILDKYDFDWFVREFYNCYLEGVVKAIEDTIKELEEAEE